MKEHTIEIRINGIVQGVGFRPFVYRLARNMGIGGWVANSGQGVIIQASGNGHALKQFSKRIKEDAPSVAVITSVEISALRYYPGSKGFSIAESLEGEERSALISPDLATCDDCLAELADPGDRRYGYPFINCTNCGPRFSIVESTPYDRPNTSMKHFPMCPECEAEYHDPANRRFHAQPDACQACGPSLSWHDYRGELIARDHCISAAAKALGNGKVVAIKGLGGFHLAVDAFSEKAVGLLRCRKGRRSKPFAIMVQTIEAARSICHVSTAEAELLSSRQRPIVLLRKKSGCTIAHGVAPGILEIGIMLPYTPVHHLLLSAPQAPKALVMTSGNPGGGVICAGNQEAIERLGGMADYFLMHDRHIVARVDDSVARFAAGRIRIIRRSRGYVPAPVDVKSGFSTILGCGAELKNTFCLFRDGKAFISQHIGDLVSPDSFDFYIEAIEHLEKCLGIEPRVAVCDLHPDYLSTRYAKGLVIPCKSVQHHQAHAAAVIAEHGLEGRVLAVVLDGAGIGPDQTIWGGELLMLDGTELMRMGHLAYMPLPGGDAAAREPWRMGMALLFGILGADCLAESNRRFGPIPIVNRRTIVEMMEKGINSPATSSCGRLFDGICALLGQRYFSEYEGQAAMELEGLARRLLTEPGDPTVFEMDRGRGYPVTLSRKEGGASDTSQIVIGTREMVGGVLRDLGLGMSREEIALKFHIWLVDSLVKVLEWLSSLTGVNRIVLAGGVFQNVILLEGLMSVLATRGFDVYTGEQVPVNDAGVSLGQAFIPGYALQLLNK